MNVDSCRQVNWMMSVGPLNVVKGTKPILKANMRTVVDQPFRLAPKEAIKLVRDNAKRGKQEALAILNKGQGLNVPLSIEASVRNPTIKFVNTVLCTGTAAAGNFSGSPSYVAAVDNERYGSKSNNHNGCGCRLG